MSKSETRRVEDLASPCFIVDLAKVKNNCKQMISRCEMLGVKLRPHMKTHKTLEAGLLMTNGSQSRIVVSTFAEAQFYFENGFNDITYAYPLGFEKVARCAEFVNKYGTFHITVDNLEIIKSLGDYKLAEWKKWSIILLVDCGYGRDGVPCDSERALELVKQITLLNNATFAGIYTHSGGSYSCRGGEAIKDHSKNAWEKLINLANRIRAEGIDCQNVGVGATPTCSIPPDEQYVNGITEFHPGNYVFYDIAQSNIGSCTVNDIAGRVLTRVLSHNLEQGYMVIDCGWLALTLDSLGKLPTGYCVFEGEPNLKLYSMSQELGKVIPVDEKLDFSKYPLGSCLKILPHHACATAAMHPVYYIHEDDKVVDEWRPVRGW